LQKKIINGKALFKANCASCHKPTMEFTGPALTKCRDREPDRDWAYRFTRNPSVMVQTNAYARAIFQKYNKTQMTAFGEQLTRDEVTAILDYCDNEGILNPTPDNTFPSEPTMSDSVGSINTQSVPCGFDTIYYRSPDTTIKILPTIIAKDTMVYIDTNRPLKPEDLEGLRNGFTDPNPTSGMYDFEIKTFGWYNVDAFVEGYVGTTNVKINVQLQMQFESEMHVYLFCPERKMLSVAYDHKLNDYWFNKNQGTIPLFLNDKAIILAFGSKADKLFYGVASINIKTEQTISIKVKETTEEQLRSSIQHNNIDGIKIDLNKKVEFNIIEKPCNGTDSTKQITQSK
jgi:Cytochrome C oxidase, cbb3-type, subunit III